MKLAIGLGFLTLVAVLLPSLCFAGNNTPEMSYSLQNAQEKLTLRTTNRGISIHMTVAKDKVITGHLRVKLLFYRDEQINMHGFAYEDWTGHRAEHERKPLVFFTNDRNLEVVRGQGHHVQTLTLRQRIDDYRVELTIRAQQEDPYFVSDLRIVNTGSKINRLMVVRLVFEQLHVNGAPAQEWTSAPLYKNYYFTRGRVAEILPDDLRLNMPPVGLVQPIIFVGDTQANGCALAFSPWLANYGAIILSARADLAYSIFVDKYLEPFEEHHVGSLLCRIMTEGWRQGLTRFTKSVPARFGLVPNPNIPQWVRDLRVAAFPPRQFPLDDPRWLHYFQWAKDIGCNAIYGFGWTWKEYNDIKCAIAPENGKLALSKTYGATEQTIRELNNNLHKLGLKSVLWTPSTGASPYAPACDQNPEWFVRDEQGKPKGSWYDTQGQLWLADSNPYSEGYHRYWRDLIFTSATRGFDGVFLDGVVPRPSDAWGRPFPGRVHDGLYSAIRRLRQELDEAGLHDFAIKTEAGDVHLIDCVYWMNSPPVYLHQCLAPSRNLPQRLIERKRRFLDPDYPRLEQGGFTEHLELIGRSWPGAVPGNWHVLDKETPKGFRPEDATVGMLAKIKLAYLAGTVINLKMQMADMDPDFPLFSGPSDSELSHEKATMRRRFFNLIRQFNTLRDSHPTLARGIIDFDLFRTDQGQVPAFVRVWGKNLYLIVLNISESPQSVTLRMDDRDFQLAVPKGTTLQMQDIFSNQTKTVSRNKLRKGLSLHLDAGAAMACRIQD